MVRIYRKWGPHSLTVVQDGPQKCTDDLGSESGTGRELGICYEISIFVIDNISRKTYTGRS